MLEETPKVSSEDALDIVQRRIKGEYIASTIYSSLILLYTISRASSDETLGDSSNILLLHIRLLISSFPENMVRTLKVFVDRKTFLVRLEGEHEGNWWSITEHSRGSIYVLGFEKEEVGWLIEHLTKAIEMKSYLGFKRKYRGKFCVHLMEVCFNNHGRFIRISEFATNRKPTFLVIPEGEKGRGWENLKNALSSLPMVTLPRM